MTLLLCLHIIGCAKDLQRIESLMGEWKYSVEASSVPHKGTILRYRQVQIKLLSLVV